MAGGGAVAGGRTRAVVLLVAGALVVLLAVALTRGGGDPGAAPSVRGTSSSVASSGATDPVSGLRWVDESSLDSSTRRTLTLIRSGGPFPYPRNDGVVYHNANRVLPREPDGAYHEYTVPTPGSSSRGPRRIVTGPDGELYLTVDHYDTFRRIRPSA